MNQKFYLKTLVLGMCALLIFSACGEDDGPIDPNASCTFVDDAECFCAENPTNSNCVEEPCTFEEDAECFCAENPTDANCAVGWEYPANSVVEIYDAEDGIVLNNESKNGQFSSLDFSIATDDAPQGDAYYRGIGVPCLDCNGNWQEYGPTFAVEFGVDTSELQIALPNTNDDIYINFWTKAVTDNPEVKLTIIAGNQFDDAVAESYDQAFIGNPLLIPADGEWKLVSINVNKANIRIPEWKSNKTLAHPALTGFISRLKFSYGYFASAEDPTTELDISLDGIFFSDGPIADADIVENYWGDGANPQANPEKFFTLKGLKNWSGSDNILSYEGWDTNAALTKVTGGGTASIDSANPYFGDGALTVVNGANQVTSIELTGAFVWNAEQGGADGTGAVRRRLDTWMRLGSTAAVDFNLKLTDKAGVEFEHPFSLTRNSLSADLWFPIELSIDNITASQTVWQGVPDITEIQSIVLEITSNSTVSLDATFAHDGFYNNAIRYVEGNATDEGL